jgi:hypothetical protein
VDVAIWFRSHRKQQYQSAFQGNTITPRYCETASGLKDPGTSPVKHQRKLLAAIAPFRNGIGHPRSNACG